MTFTTSHPRSFLSKPIDRIALLNAVVDVGERYRAVERDRLAPRRPLGQSDASATNIALACGTSPSAGLRRIAALEDRGFLERCVDTEDRKARMQALEAEKRALQTASTPAPRPSAERLVVPELPTLFRKKVLERGDGTDPVLDRPGRSAEGAAVRLTGAAWTRCFTASWRGFWVQAKNPARGYPGGVPSLM